MKRNRWALALGLALCLVMAGVLAAPRAAWADGYNALVHLVLGGLGLQVEDGGTIWVESGGRIIVASGGALMVQPGAAALLPDAHVTGTVRANEGAFTETVTIGTFLQMPAQAAITVTNGAAFTPTGTLQPITAASNVTPTLAMGTEGDVVILVNRSDVTIALEANGTLAVPMQESGSVELGLNDTLTLWYSGSKWYAVATANNSSE